MSWNVDVLFEFESQCSEGSCTIFFVFLLAFDDDIPIPLFD